MPLFSRAASGLKLAASCLLLAGACTYPGSPHDVDCGGSGEGAIACALLYNIARARYVAVGGNCTYWTSNSGSEWQQRTMPDCASGGSLLSVTYGNGVYVAVGDNAAATGCSIYTSANGANWTRRQCASSQTEPLNRVAFANGVFLAGSSCFRGTPPSPTFLGQRSIDGGANWVQTTIFAAGCGGAFDTASLVGTGSTFIWAQTNNFLQTRRSIDSGLTFPTLGGTSSLATTAPGRALLPSGRIVSYGESAGTGATDFSDDSGVTYSGATGATLTRIRALAGRSDSRVVALADNCTLAISTNNATTWGASTTIGGSCVNINFRGLIADPANGQFVAAGNSGGGNEVFGLSANGDPGTWQVIPLPNSNPVNALAGAF